MKNSKTRLAILLCALFVTLSLIYVWQKDEAERLEGYRFLIGLSLPNATTSRHSQLLQRVHHQQASHNSFKVIAKEAQDSPSQQLNDLRELEQQGIDLLIIEPLQDPQLFEQLKMLNVPVIVLHEESAHPYADVFLTYHHLQGAQFLAHSLLSADPQPSELLLLSGDEYDPVSRAREEAFLATLPPALRTKVERVYCHWSRNEAENTVKAYLVSGKPLSSIVALDEQMALGARLACQKFRVPDVDLYAMTNLESPEEKQLFLRESQVKQAVGFDSLYTRMIEHSLKLLEQEDLNVPAPLQAHLLTSN